MATTTTASDPMGMTALLNQFVEWSRIRNYSPHTVKHRQDYLRIFIAWAEQRGLTRPAEITMPILERFQRFLFHFRKANGDPLSARSQLAHLVQLRAWFRWLARYNHILFNPASELELPRQEQHLPRFVLTPHEAELVLSGIDLGTGLGIRDRAIVETLYSTGVRRAELAGLSVCDVDQSRGTVLVRLGKGKKDRLIPIGDRALLWVQKYLDEVRPKLILGDRSGNTLFLTQLGGPLSLDGLTKMVAKAVDRAQLGKRGSCHLFRHSMATAMLENGADIRFIQAMLGHTSLTTTQIYTHVSIVQLKKVHTATHPARLERTVEADGASGS